MIAGVDEVGRGCIAGPVVAAAVILGNSKIEGIKDSKKLSPKNRQYLAKQIKDNCIDFALAFVDVATIDKINILQASLQAMQCAVVKLQKIPSKVLVDGNHLPKWSYNSACIIGGDNIRVEIAAASIIAKVARDNYMCDLEK